MIDRLPSWLQRWVRFWDHHEHPRTLSLIRILLGACLVYDFASIWWMDLVVPLFGAQEIGGLSDALARKEPPLVYQLLPGTEATARALHAAITVSAVSFTLGFFTRTSALVLLLSWSQFQDVLPVADRGIDLLCRDVLCIFVFAKAGAAWSLDAAITTGRLRGDDRPVPSWPRYLLIAQLVVMYFTAGVQKTGIHWWPMGHFAALYFILQDPNIARFDFTWLENQPWFFLTQVGTASTIAFQCTYPLVLLWTYYKFTPDKGGRLRAFSNRWHLDLWWIGIGVYFHLALAATTELGIFPWAMLALYPCFFHPDELAAGLRWARRRLGLKEPVTAEAPAEVEPAAK